MTIRSLIRSPIRSGIRSIIDSGQGDVTPPEPGLSSIADLFTNGEYGGWYDVSDTSTLYQDSSGTTAVTSNGDPIGLIQDKSGNSADAVQTVSAARPTYNSAIPSADLDLVDDNMTVTLASPVAGSMIMKLSDGYVIGKISASGSWDFTDDTRFFPTPEIEQLIFIDRDLTASEILEVKGLLGSDGAFSGVTSAQNWFRGRTDLVELDVSNWDTSNVNNFSNFLLGCTSLTSLDLSNLDTSSVNNFSNFLLGCTSLTSLDLSNLDTSSVNSFIYFAFGASGLSNVIVNGGTGSPFSDSPCTNYTNAFTNTNLTQQSIDDILVAIEAAGTSSGTFNQSGGSAPSTTGETAIDALRARGWTISVTGGY